MLKNKFVLIGAALFLGAAFWFYVKPNYLDSKAAPVYTEEEIAAAPRPTLTLPERVLNLAAPASSPNYVKASFALEFADPDHDYIGLEGEAVVKANEEFAIEKEPEMHRIWDVVTTVVGSRSIEQVSTTEGREALKTDLVAALNDELGEGAVEHIFLVTFITQ
jgi:flagellar basal body-associated protein FliL